MDFLTNKNDLRKKLLFFLFIIFTELFPFFIGKYRANWKTKGRFLQQIFQNQPDKSIFENIKNHLLITLIMLRLLKYSKIIQYLGLD